MAEKLKLSAIYFGMAGVSLSIVGCLGGNTIIGIAQGLLILSMLLFWGAWLATPDRKPLRPKLSSFRPSMIMLVVLIVVCAASILFNLKFYDSPLKDMKKLRYELIVVIMLLIPQFRSLFNRPETVHKGCFYLLWGSVVIVTLAGVSGYLFGVNPLLRDAPKVAGRIGGVSGTQMTFGYTIQFFVLMAASMLVMEFKGKRWMGFPLVTPWKRYVFLIATFILIFAGLYFSYCRGALLAVGVGGLTLLVLSKSKILWGAAIAGIILIGVYSLKTEARYTKLLKNGFKISHGDSVRIAQWESATLAFFDHPLTGVGHRQFEKQSDELKKKYGFPPRYKGGYFRGHAHNNYLEAFASSGVFGGLAFIGFCLFWFYELSKTRDARIYYLPVVVAFMVSGFFENTFTDSEVLHSILLIYFFSQIAIDSEEPIALT